MQNELVIFINENKITLCHSSAVPSEVPVQPAANCNVQQLIVQVLKSDKDAYIVTDDVDAALAKFSQQVHVQQAGGGLVRNQLGQYLLILRRGKWDLPKGKLDEGETIQECALREVEEETGVTKLSLGSCITKTYHLYQHRQQWILKQTTWYHMSTTNIRLVPQAEEDITDAQWRYTSELAECKRNTYKNIEIVLQHVM